MIQHVGQDDSGIESKTRSTITDEDKDVACTGGTGPSLQDSFDGKTEFPSHLRIY